MNIGGVDVDGVMILSDDAQIFIEITEQRDLQKVREDVIKLETARNAYLAEHRSFPRCFCVVNGTITTGMKGAGATQRINVLSYEDFANIFFDFGKYRFARDNSAFGSAVNPLTGVKDQRDYIPVSYQIDGSSASISLNEIAKKLLHGERIILLGEYGTGKSRCSREIFRKLAETASSESLYPIALNLRDFWGLQRAQELFNRHIAELGLEMSVQTAAIRALNAERTILLLDGFDELGSQSWSNDTEKLKVIRAKSLDGVRDLIARGKNGVLVSGREHYFNGNAEMFSALGLSERTTTVIRCKSEFTEAEMQAFFAQISVDIVLPDWLPRRPLICQTIADMPADDLDQMFGVGQDELSFWDHFIKVMCERDANIRASFDARTIESVLSYLARLTRTRAANVGPITLADVQAAFESVVGQLPVEEASLMLQRLPALGRVKAESNERQFIDTYILDGLRAKDISSLFQSPENVVSSVLQTSFSNPLDDLGQRILARDIEKRSPAALSLAKRASNASNRTLASDIAASFLRTDMDRVDFERLSINDGHFIRFDMSKTVAVNLSIDSCVIGTLVLPSSVPPQTSLSHCLAERVIGVADPTGLPKWITDFHADKYDSTESISRIRQLGLKPPQEILVTIIRKTFFQKGTGRKEEALLRGLGQLASKGVANEILNRLLKDNILTVFKGNEGPVYAPNRKHAGRMKKMLYELQTSQDSLWTDITAI
jgi:hypothetical protein